MLLGQGAGMSIGAVFRAIIRHSGVHLILAMIFAATWFIHYVAITRMEMSDRQFASMDDGTMRAMALVDLLAVNYWWAISYALLAFAAVAFLQIRARPVWTYWLTAATFCAPCTLYWVACAHIAVGKLL
jgi:hypothetical protein